MWIIIVSYTSPTCHEIRISVNTGGIFMEPLAIELLYKREFQLKFFYCHYAKNRSYIFELEVAKNLMQKF